MAGIKAADRQNERCRAEDNLQSDTKPPNAIQRVAHEMVTTEYALWNDELAPALAKNNIRIHEVAQPLNLKTLPGPAVISGEEVTHADAAGGGREPSLSPAAEQSHQQLIGARTTLRGGEFGTPSCGSRASCRASS